MGRIVGGLSEGVSLTSTGNGQDSELLFLFAPCLCPESTRPKGNRGRRSSRPQTHANLPQPT